MAAQVVVGALAAPGGAGTVAPAAPGRAGTVALAGTVTLATTDCHGGRVVLRAEPALLVSPHGPGRGFAVAVAAAPAGAEALGLTGAQWAVSRGTSDRGIAAELGLSSATVHEHVAALHARLGTSTCPRLVAELAAAS